MLSFLKHKMSRKEKLIAQWSATHVVIALVFGVTLAGGWVLAAWHGDGARVRELGQQATETARRSLPVPMDTGKIGGSFTLTDQDGKPVSDKDFAGQYLLIYFGYTSCPDMCPTGLQSMSRAMDMMKSDADKVQPLFITVDPARDTPEKIKEYDASFNPEIIGLTGTPAQIAAVAKEYQVYYKKEEGDQDYVVDHSTQIYLMSPSGGLVTTFDEQVDPKIIIAALHKAWNDGATGKP